MDTSLPKGQQNINDKYFFQVESRLFLSLLTLEQIWNNFIEDKFVVFWISFCYVQSNWLGIGNEIKIQVKDMYAMSQSNGSITSNLGISILSYWQTKGIDPLVICFDCYFEGKESTIRPSLTTDKN